MMAMNVHNTELGSFDIEVLLKVFNNKIFLMNIG